MNPMLAQDPELQAIIAKLKSNAEIIEALQILARYDAAQRVRFESVFAPASTDQSIHESIKPVLGWHGYTLKAIRGRSRDAEIARCRFECIYVAHKKTGARSARLGRFFNRDHGSILHAIKTVETHLKEIGATDFLSPSTKE